MEKAVARPTSRSNSVELGCARADTGACAAPCRLQMVSSCLVRSGMGRTARNWCSTLIFHMLRESQVKRYEHACPWHMGLLLPLLPDQVCKLVVCATCMHRTVTWTWRL